MFDQLCKGALLEYPIIGLAKNVFLHFAYGVAWQGLDKLDALGLFEAGQIIFDHVGHVFRRNLDTILRDNDRHDSFAKILVRDTNDRAFNDARQVVDQQLDL